MPNTIAAYTIGGITRPELILDNAGNIILTPEAAAFQAAYGTKALYFGCPVNTPFPPVAPTLSAPVDSNAGINSVLENAAVGSQVGLTVQATNLNGSPVTYALTADSSGGAFKINATTGVVTVANGALLDYESSTGHTITVQAISGSLTTSQTFTIAVADINDNAPVFNSGSGANAANTPENVPTTTVVYTAHASDADGTAANNTVTYSLAVGGDNDLFNINAVTGAVTFKVSPDADHPQDADLDNVYDITVMASDGLPAHNVSLNVSITVMDVNEAPVIDSNGGGNSATVGIDEGTTAVTTVTATDPDVPAQTLSFSVLTGAGSPDGAKFSIDGSGNLTFIAPPDFEAFGSAAGNNTYVVQVQVTDNGSPPLNDIQTITVNVADLNESTPVITSPASIAIDENLADGASVGSVVATDADGSAPNNALTYTVTGGTGQALFDLNPTTGALTVRNGAVLDREAAPSYTLDIRVADGGTPSLFTTQTLTINLNDLNDNTPVITSAVAMAVDENAAGGTLVGTVTAVDNDATAANNVLTYTAVGGSGLALFDIDPVSGAITVHAGAVLDRETAASYTLDVQIADNGTPGLFTIETIQINLNDLNEFAPTITSPATMSVDEGSASGTLVGTVTATDGDATAPNNTITYAATGGTGFGLFDVNPTTGAVMVKVGAILNFEAAPSYALDITATDGGALFGTQTLTIELNNLAPVFATPPDSNASNNQTYHGAPAGSSIGIGAAANDPAGGTATYSLLDTLGDRFAIDPATGVVTVGISPIVFSTTTSADNTVTITVRASDAAGLYADHSFNIVILDELPPEVTAGHTLNYTENQNAAVIDPALIVTDANNATLTGATVQITADYVQGEDVLAFANTPNITATFNPATGMLTLVGIDTVANYQAALRAVTYFNTSDNPSAAPREVTFKANDGIVEGGATGTINVTPVNDAPSISASHILGYTENQAPTAIDPALALIDLDSADITGAVVQITGNYVIGEDILDFTPFGNITGVFTPANGKMTLSGTDTVANYQAALRAITYFNTSDDPSTLSRTLTITATDGAATSTPVTDTIIVTAVDDAPVVVAGHTLSYSEGNPATVIDALVTVSDDDSANLTSATVQITGNYADGQDLLAFTPQFGITGSFNPTTGTLSLSGIATVAQYQTVLRSVTYANGSTNPSTLDRTVTITTSDGNSSSVPATATIQVAAVNSPPDLQPHAPPAVGYTENAATATALLAGGTVVDPDAPLNFALGSFTIEITANDAAGDQIVMLGSPAFAVSGASLLYNGHLVGTISGLGTISVSVADLTAIATPTVVNLLARAFGFQNTTETPAAGPRTVTFTFHDGGNTGGGDLSNSVTQTVNVTAVNDAPVNTTPAGTQLATENTDLVFSAANGNAISISDPDILGGTETVTLTATGGTLTLASTANLTVTGDNSASVELTGTIADINAALNGLIYHATTAGNNTLTIVTSDNGNTPAPAQSDSDTISILVVTPAVGVTLDLDDDGAGTGFSTIFSENSAAVPIADTDAIIGTASLTIASATIVLTNHQPGDVLLVGSLPPSIAASSYDTTTGVLTLTGTAATVAEFQTALSQITFFNGTQDPATSNRTISVVVNDGTSNSNIAITTIQVTGSNDAPVVDLDGSSGGVNYATNYVATGSFTAIAAANATVTDADNATLASATVVLTNAQTNDVLAISGALPGGITANIDTAVANQITVTLSGPASTADFQAALKQVVFANSGPTPDLTPRTVTVTVSDGTDSSAVATTTITIAANTAPVANDDAASAVEAGGINNTVAGSNPTGNVITDVGGADIDAEDGPAGLTVVAVKTGPEGSPVTTGIVGTALQGTYGKLTLNANGSYSYALDNSNATVQGLTSASLPLTDVFNYTIQDSGGASDTALLTITINGADDLPQAVADFRTITEDAAPTTFNVLANDVIDPDAGAFNTITTGTVTASGPAGANIDPGDVTVELVNGGTEIRVTLGADFQRLTGSETATITIPYTLTGNTGETSTANLVITVNGVNDLPVAVNDSGSMTENDGPTTFPSVLGNDTLDKDHGALNTITTGTVTASGPAGTNIDGGDVTVSVIGGTQIRITLGADFQRLQQGQTATIDVPYTLHGDGADASSATFQVTVSGANDAPVVTAGAGATFTENGAAVSIAGSLTLTDIDNTSMTGAVVTLTNAQAGDVLSVQGQGTSGTLASGVHFEVDNVAHTVTFSNVDSVADYQAALRLVQFSNPGENPSATTRSFTITANDGEASSNIGSASASLTVVAIDDAPVNTVPADSAVPTAFSNTDTPISGISVTDVDAGTGIITTQLSVAHGTVAVTLAGGATISAGASGSATLTLSGSVDAINATLANNVIYRSTDGYLGQDDLVVVTNDQGFTGSGGPLTDTDTVHIGVVPQVWYIDNTNSGSGNGSGTAADPFHSIAAFNASAGPGINDYIVLRTGTGTYSGDGINLQDGQQLYGAGETLQFTNPVTSQTITIPNAGARPTINVTTNGDQGIDLAANNTVKGINITTAAGTIGLDDGEGVAGNNVGNLVIERVTISGAGSAVDIDHGGVLNVSLEAVSSSGGAQGIQLAGGLTGNFTVTGNLNITNSTTAGIDISGNTGNYTFSGSSNVINTGTHTAVSLNTGGSVNFGGGLDIDTTSGTGFSASGGVIITITGGGNSVTSTTGQVLNWSGVSVGASGVTFGSLGATGTVANTAIKVNDVDGTGTFSGGNVTIAGTSGGGSDGIRIDGGSAATFNFSTTTIDNTGGDGIELNGANGNVTFSSVDIDGVAGSGLNIAGNTNAITVSGGSIGSTNDPGGNAVNIAGGSGNISIAASVTKNTAGGDVVEITGRTGGTVTFSGAISASGGGGGIDIDANTGGTINFNGQTALSTGAINGVDLTSNTGTTINFNAGGNGLDITTTTGVGFNATGGGTVNVQSSGNSISSSSATALNVVNTTIGANNLTFESISSGNNTAAADPVSGIILNNTGTSGHLTVTGTGSTAGSGGTIQNTTGDAVSLTNTQDVNLNYMNISGAGGNGIAGNTLSGLVLNKLNISGNGNSASGNGEGNIYLFELTGNASHVTTFNNLSVTNSYVHNVFIQNTGGTLADLVVTNSTFSNNGASTVAGSEFVINLATGGITGTPTATVHATHNTFSGNLTTPSTYTATGFQGSSNDGTLNVHLGDGTAGGLNTFDTNNSGITLSSALAGNLNFDVNNNLVTHNRAVGIAVNHFGTGTVTGFLRNTTVGTQGQAGSGAQIGNGLDLHDEAASGSMTLSVTNNIIQSVGGSGLGFEGINAQIGVGAQNSASTFNLTLTGNTIRDIVDDRGLFVNNFNTAGASVINANISGNTFSNANASGANTTARVGGAPGGSDHVNVTQASAAALAAANGLTASAAPGNNMRVDTNVFFNQAAPPSPPATPQMALNGQGPGSSEVVKPDELTPLLAVAIAHWVAAGASAAQKAQMEYAAAHIIIDDLPNSGFLANSDEHGIITIDGNAAGWGWFIDSTPADNAEFHTTTVPNQLMANGGNAASHIDLLTVLVHELGHVIGLADSTSAGVMNVALDAGERRLPDPADVALANPGQAQAQAQAQAPLLPIIRGTAGNDTIDAGHGGVILVGGAGADNFVFANVDVRGSTPPPLTHVADYKFAEGDSFDFSALTAKFHYSDVVDATLVRVVEDPSGSFATLQFNTNAKSDFGPHWTNVAQIDGAHAGDDVGVLLDSHGAVHLAHLHVGLLA